MQLGKQFHPFQLDEVVPLFAALLSVAVPEKRYPPLNLSPQQQRQRTHDALAAWMVEEAKNQSALMIWEDLHLADASTLELVGLAMDQTPTVPVLNVLPVATVVSLNAAIELLTTNTLIATIDAQNANTHANTAGTRARRPSPRISSRAKKGITVGPVWRNPSQHIAVSSPIGSPTTAFDGSFGSTAVGDGTNRRSLFKP